MIEAICSPEAEVADSPSAAWPNPFEARSCIRDLIIPGSQSSPAGGTEQTCAPTVPAARAA